MLTEIHDEETVTVTLNRPVTFGEGEAARTYATLTFREATVGDLVAADAMPGDMARTIAVLAAVSGTPLPAFSKIRQSDLRRILAAAGHLVGNEQASA